MAQQQRSGKLLLAFEGEQSYWSKRAASLTMNIRISSLSEILFKKLNFAHKLILETYLCGRYLAIFRQFWLLHFQKHTHMPMPIFEIFLHSGPQWGGEGGTVSQSWNFPLASHVRPIVEKFFPVHSSSFEIVVNNIDNFF